MPSTNEPTHFPFKICPKCGLINIIERQRCKHCEAALRAPMAVPRISPRDPGYRVFRVPVPAIPMSLLIVLFTISAVVTVLLCVLTNTYFLLIWLITPLFWFLNREPNKPKDIIFACTPHAFDYDHPDLHICSDWKNVKSITNSEFVYLHLPAATRVVSHNRNDGWTPLYQRERVFSLRDFDDQDITSIIGLICQYAPHTEIINTTSDEGDEIEE